MELPLAHVLAHIECRGIQLDTDRLREIGGEVGTQLAALETEIHALAGLPFNIDSPKQLADVLFGKLSLPIVRKTKTGPSTDADTLEELAALHPVPAKIVDYRVLSKLKGTYIDALPALVNPRHRPAAHVVQPGGRRDGAAVVEQPEPAEHPDPDARWAGASARRSSPSPGTCWCRPTTRRSSCGSSRTSPRIRRSWTRSARARTSTSAPRPRCSACPPASVTAEHRRIAKAINFGLSYGQSDFGLAQVLRIPRAQARAYIQSYFERYAGVRAYMERSIAEARATAETVTLLGRRRPLPEIRATRAQDRNYAERIARNTPIQGSAADLLKLAMIRVDQAIEARKRARPRGRIAADRPRRTGVRGPGRARRRVQAIGLKTRWKLCINWMFLWSSTSESGHTWGDAH